MDDELVVAIKKETEQVFGRRIVSSRDCNALSEEIFTKTGFKINSNTLRRFFGLVKASHPASSGTLQILSTYCGFKSGDEIKKLHNWGKGGEIILTESNILDYLIYPFENIQVKAENDETFLSLVKGVIIFINRYPQLAHKFHREIAKTHNGQVFYFEQFVNLDKLNSFYGDGIRYYLAEKKTVDAQIFGHSLLVFRYWLTKDNEKLSTHFKALKAIRPVRSSNPFICGRYFSSRLYYAHSHGLNTEKLLIEAHKSFYSLRQSDEGYSLYRSFEYVFVQALVLTGHHEEALFYIQNVKKSVSKRRFETDIPFYETLVLLETMALFKSGSHKQAERIFNDIKPSSFYFLSKKYKTILYLWITNFCKRAVGKTNDQLKALIEETGFIRFNDDSFSSKAL